LAVMSSIETQVVLPSSSSQESCGGFPKASISDANQGNGGRTIASSVLEIDVHDSQKNLLDAKEAYHREGGNKAMITVGEQLICSGLGFSALQDCDIDIEGNSGSTVPGENGLTGRSDFHLEPKLENCDSVVTFESYNKLPGDSSSLFGALSLQEVSSTNEQFLKKNEESSQLERLERDTAPEEWSLFYKDPQGETQGPFLGVDIISWFDQGFFGTDLLVCLSDAPDGTAFQELGDLMPHLKLKSLTNSDGNLVSDAVSSIPEPSHQSLHDLVSRDK
ncbi:hypothetical protein MKW94_009717, partial [Papaver nudicaule]|nr:hypothetical protein [Papaver nudicaule]